jgi:hypothetical protein
VPVIESSWLGIMEMGLVLGAALGWGFWELYSLRKDKRRGEPEAPEED